MSVRNYVRRVHGVFGRPNRLLALLTLGVAFDAPRFPLSMAKIHHDTTCVEADSLRKLVSGVLLDCGLRQDDAEYVADYLVETTLRGTDSHGVARLGHYVRRLAAGSIRPKPAFKFEQRSTSTGVLDGDHGQGHLVVRAAADEAVRLAKGAGSGWVSVKNSSHCGALGPLGLWIADQGMIGFVLTHVDPMVLPHGATEPFCGTNPLCLTAPGRDGRSLCLDIATSIVPWNIVANAATEGARIPAGWAVDGRGRDTEDPTAVKALYPFGEHKGSGLGIMIDVLCALLSDSPYGPDIPKMYGDMTEHRRLGGLVGALAIDRFTDPQRFSGRVEEMIRRLGGLATAPGVERVLFPGEPELLTRRERLQNGIPLGCRLFEELNALADTRGLPRLKSLAQDSVAYG